MKTISKGSWVFDTNLLIYALDLRSPFHPKTRAVFDLMLQGRIQGIVSTQNIIETINVLLATYHLSGDETVEMVETLLSDFHFQVISPFPTTHHRVFTILRKIQRPKDIYDLFLAATLLDNNCSRLLSANDKDFRQIPELEVVNPFTDD